MVPTMPLHRDGKEFLQLPNSRGVEHLVVGKRALGFTASADRPATSTAAIVNWYGITDAVDILDGVNMQTYAVAWTGSMPNREEIGRRVSPLTYVRAGTADSDDSGQRRHDCALFARQAAG
jgi:hypothetical protein